MVFKIISLFCIILIVSTSGTLAQNSASGLLTSSEAGRLAQLPLKCLQKEYPNKLNQTLADATELAGPRVLHPAFYGCFDWHSSVHGHWMLVRLLKMFPEMENAGMIRERLSENITPENIAMEVQYFQRPHEKSWERTYGWAWLLKLAEELHTWNDPLGRQLEHALYPLTETIAAMYLEFLPKLNYPIRVGEHTNTAFGLAFAHDYARTTGNQPLLELLEKRAMEYFGNDQGCPFTWEPGGYDFFSPCLEEADLMRRILQPDAFRVWLQRFLPELASPDYTLVPARVSDRTDGKLVHLDGLNFSRARCLYGIAESLPEYRHLTRTALEHIHFSLPSIVDGSYEGEHWLASFALLALTAGNW